MSPLTSETASISPSHLSITFFEIIYVSSSIVTTTFPSKLSLSMLLVSNIFSFVLIASFYLRFLPMTLSRLHTVLKDTRVRVSVNPFIHAIPFSSAISILS